MSFIIFDTEYTTWPGCQENGWHGTQKKEIVQIAALKVSDEWEVLAEFNALCRPVFNPVLSDYFIDLTHINNEAIQKNGRPFEAVYQEFVSFVGEDICYSHAWGSDYQNESDGKIIKENLKLYQINETQKIIYRNIAPILKVLYIKNNISVEQQTSGQIAHILGIDWKLRDLKLDVHNALYDVYSILEGLRFFGSDARYLMDKEEQP